MIAREMPYGILKSFLIVNHEIKFNYSYIVSNDIAFAIHIMYLLFQN